MVDGWQYRGLVTVRMLYLIFVRLTDWMALLAGSDEYAAHYNRHRPHRVRDLHPPGCGDIITAPATDLATARRRRHEVLGGLTHECERAA